MKDQSTDYEIRLMLSLLGKKFHFEIISVDDSFESHQISTLIFYKKKKKNK